jgi:DNA polymerase-3 subunit delta
MSLYVLHGPDQFRAREALQRIREGLDSDGNLGNNTTRLEGRGLSPADLRAACHAASFFVENRLVIVEGMQARLSGTRRRGSSARAQSRRAAASADAPSDFEQFVDILLTAPESTTVVLLDESAPNALIEALGSAAKVSQFPVLRGQDLRGWVAERCKERGANFTNGAIERLVGAIDGNHLGELAQEIDKLATYAGGKPVQAADVDEMVSGAVQFQIWDLTDAVIEGRGDRALSVLRQMDAKDYPPQLLIFMLVRQYRQTLLAQSMLRDGMSQPQIGSELGITSSFPLRKVVDQASRYPAEPLEQAYRRLLQCDVSVKTGVLDVDTALQMLILELAELAKGPRGRERASSRY